ncbi:phosphoribosylaminoimidazolesuccinocarboxamide synthase [bacterium]|jgi:phosphoribosylaminoimidazole-succinocarboxamide synthase|nr:phosphoribosylaminoimidazolesuccinocarboxamide synthase [bacterium]MBT6831625.1 phosphoribosylaminoimidazolesuccinocarboxamide synthase [bacterium]MBT6996270.1 phosphoribosylaminoimidazolesuccinocarboxamide synthase [bacterium]MBT7772948.1 phosphoribosylaminoimidazolesuccinocarboxamide synthase [bacterium]
MNEKIKLALGSTVDKISFSGAVSHHSGKVRESFVFDENTRAIVVTDRISAFDFILGTVPFKGQVLNQIAAWWFRKMDGLIPHHLISTPDPNISLTKNARVLPIEIIVRGYLTGTTKTSSWYAYQHLNREICGLTMPAGMKKNQKFTAPIVTPTTKPTEPGAHDESISREEILSQKIIAPEIWEKCEKYALKMFARGQEIAAERGLILVDTKYEMGIDADGNLIVIDEVHTPDSSRFWIADSYDARFNVGQEPEALSKEFVRSAIVDRGYDVDDADADPGKFLDDELRAEASARYIELFERVTGEKFQFPENLDATVRIEGVLDRFSSPDLAE